jgi:hypothetical protein
MRKIIATAACVGLLTGYAHAQTLQERQKERGGKVEKTPMQQIEEERARRAQDVDRDYEAARKRSLATPAPTVAVDPWRTVRPSASAPGDKK